MAIDFEEALDPAEPEFSTSVNITPLIDVLLVLLVMFIITIPIQLHSVNIEMPSGAPPPLSREPVVVKIEVSAQSEVSWNGEPLADRDALVQQLQMAAQLGEQPEIHVRAHRNAKYDAVTNVLSAAQRLGLQRIGVVGLNEYAR
jgi:biopolymer transport protein ExbD